MKETLQDKCFKKGTVFNIVGGGNQKTGDQAWNWVTNSSWAMNLLILIDHKLFLLITCNFPSLPLVHTRITPGDE